MHPPADATPKPPGTHGRRWLAVLGVVLISVIAWPLLRWRQLSSDALRQLLKAEVLKLSDSVYVLHISPVRLRVFPGAVGFDSVRVTTDTARRAVHKEWPVLDLAAARCQLSGVDLPKLIRKQGLYGKVFGCGSIQVGAAVSPRRQAAPAAPSGPRKFDFLKMRQEFRLPKELPVLAVERVDFPDIELYLTRQQPGRPAERVALHKFAARFDDVVIDPQQPASERRPLFSRQIALAAQELAVGSGDATVGFRSMSADLGEASFTLHQVRMDPGAAPWTWFRRQRYRRPWIKLYADSIKFAGIDFAQLIQDGRVVTEQAIIGGFHVAVETDAALPPAPRSAARQASDLHEAASTATAGAHVEVDMVRVIDGGVHYVGHRPGIPDAIISAPRISFLAASVLVDPSLPRAKQRPLLARVLQLDLDSVSWATSDSLKSLAIGDLHLRTTDSVLVARRIAVGPLLSDSAWMRRQKFRQSLGRAFIDSIVMRGTNYDRLVTGGGLAAREMDMEGAAVRLVRNMALPPAPPVKERARPTLDSTLADLAVRARIAGVSANGRLTYVEQHPGLPPREFLVDRLQLTGTHIAIGDSGRQTPPPLLSQHLTLALIDITRHWGTTQSIAIGQIVASLGDSTLTVDSVRLAPPFSPQPRRTRVHLALDSLRFAGVDYVALADGRRAAVRQAIVGSAGLDVRVDLTVPEHEGPKRPASPKPEASFRGFDVPISVADLRILRAHGRYAQVRGTHIALLVSAERLTVTGRKLGYQRGVTAPLLRQDIVARAGGVAFASDAVRGRVRDAAINLGDSTIAVDGITLRLAAAARDSSPERKTGGTGAMLAADSVRLAGLDVEKFRLERVARMRSALIAGLDLELTHSSGPAPRDSEPPERRGVEKAGVFVAIGDLEVPGARFRLVTRHADTSPSAISVRRASVSAADVSFDPASLKRHGRLARRVAVAADGIVLSDNPMNSFLIGSLAASLHDSTATVRDVRIGPTVSDSVWTSRQEYRHTRIKVGADSVVVGGLDYDRLFKNDGLWVRHATVYRFDLSAMSDKKIPGNPVSKLHSTAQHDVRSIRLPFGVDTATVVDGAVLYEEYDPDRPEPGQLTFSHIAATVTGFTSRGVAGRSPPLRIQTKSLLFGAGALEADATVPLTSQGFDAEYHGRLGPMPATAVNQFVSKTMPVLITGGEVIEVTFSVGAKDGHAVGTLTPVYRDLEVKLRDPRASFFKRLEYSVITFLAKEFVIRHDNPGKAGRPPRVGAVDHTFVGETIINFLWFAVRGGIKESMMK